MIRKGTEMDIGFVGLGRMGANMAVRLAARGHSVSGYDAAAGARDSARKDGIKVANSLVELIDGLAAPRVLWLMLPAAITEAVVGELEGLLDAGDVVVDGGNGNYLADVAHAKRLAEKSIGHLDCGTSGGVWGRERGYCLMIGGERAVFDELRSVFHDLAPGVGAAPRTAETGGVSDAEEGFLYCGDHGAGHFVKMVHNGIEYGMMASLAEGFAILQSAGIGREARAATAEVAPLENPEAYSYAIPVPEVAELWRRGSVVSSWLLDLTASAMAKDPELSAFEGRVSDSGEGRWTAKAAIDEGVPAPTILAALNARFASQGAGTYSGKVLSAMRSEFGGHSELTGQG